MYLAFLVVPFQGQARVTTALPFSDAFVVLLDYEQIVELYYLLWRVCKLHFHVLLSVQRSVEIKFAKVNGHNFCALRENDAVEQDTDHKKICCGCAVVTRMVDKVTSYGGAYSVWVVLPRASITNNPVLGYILKSIRRHLTFVHS